jgi:hypothetical protein
VDSMNGCDIFDSDTSLIVIDNVKSVNHFEYSGFVYDVESPQGWVSANNIITSNCRCTLTYGIE